jgi:demethylmenaquinone methyltransferase/2-methoxy-6-polyprenyl-1,4-benzoquinol methylase
VGVAVSERNRTATRLFAPLAPTYDRYARLLSFGQDPRWRRFLVSRIDAAPDWRVLDVATGTAAVAIGLAQRYGCTVVGVDQCRDMLAAGERRVASSGLAGRVRLEQARAEELPFADGSFDALTFTYLLRYVDDPEATMRELARVVRPGAPVASLEFHLPPQPARSAWELYTRVGLPALGRLISPGWHEVGRFLGPSIRGFWRDRELGDLVELWESAGIRDVRARTLSLGGGVVVWGRRGG